MSLRFVFFCLSHGQQIKVGTAQQIKAKHGACHELMLRLRPETEDGGAWESRWALVRLVRLLDVLCHV